MSQGGDQIGGSEGVVRGVDVVLVAPPFLSVLRPSMGLSAIKGGLNARGIASEVWYLNVEFARLVGLRLSEWISTSSPVNLLLGEWIFSSLCCDYTGERAERDRQLPNRAQERLPPGSLGTVEALTQARVAARAFIEASARRLLAANPRILGISSSFQQTCAGLALARRIKELAPEIVVCIGGANCDGPMGAALAEEFPQLDYVFVGESDLTFPDFVAERLRGQGGAARPRRRLALADSRAPEGLIHGEPIQALDELPMPDMIDYFRALERTGLGASVNPGLVFEASRGCWWGAKHHCTFCGLNADGIEFRSKSSSRVLREIEHLSERHGISEFQVVDNILNPKHIAGVFDALADSSRHVSMFFEVKANMKHEQLRRLARAGVTHVQPGIESLSDRILTLMDKGVSALQNIAFLRSCREIGIVPWWNILYRFPQETLSCYSDQQALVPLLEHLDPPSSASPVRLDRFSPYFERSSEYGYTDVKPFDSYAQIFNVDDERASQLAYFFTGRAENILSREQMVPFLDALTWWRRRHQEGAERPVLQLIETEGVGVVLDTRAHASCPISHLNEEELGVLRLFRRPASLERVVERRGGDAVRIIEGLLERGFIVAIASKAVSIVCESTRGIVTDSPRFPGGALLSEPRDGVVLKGGICQS